MKTLSQFLKECFGEPLLEMARIDNPDYDKDVINKKEIWIYGNDRTSMSPHFHYFATDKSFEVEISISTLDILKSKPRKGIPKNRLLTWEGLSDERKRLKKWLLRMSHDMPLVTNYEMLIVSWNQNNRTNPVIKPLNWKSLIEDKL